MAPSIFFLFCTWIVCLILLPTSFVDSLCRPDESFSLMEFKQSFRIDRTEWLCDYPKVESWSLDGHGDCCSWDGVKCDEATGHVTGLDLNGSCLVDAQLSGPIPSSLGNLTRLVRLYLSSNNLQGEIPNSLWELKDLEILDLSGNNLSGTVDLHRLENLEELYLDFNNISFVSGIEMNTMLSKLFYLSLESCNLQEFPKILGHLRGLERIYLSHNKIGGRIPTWMGNGSRESLWYVDLSHNILTSFVDNRINILLPNLTYLDISSNLLKTELPTPPPSVSYYNISNNILFGDIQSICGAKSLVTLDLSSNSLNGTIPSCLKNIHSLEILDLGKNKLDGSIP
ncbi:receptor-like protein 39 [Rhodamnia argentea]|uniref:Receptor-like protein 39 n=1 Tax=Rhodamnia argentea TaxID=178133 RepID=A0ABM3H4W3_9MYRT|nr:receptor-like protein 39 [Rhodamnia argentea]